MPAFFLVLVTNGMISTLRAYRSAAYVMPTIVILTLQVSSKRLNRDQSFYCVICQQMLE